MKRLRVRFPPTSDEFADTYDFINPDGEPAQGELRDVRLHDDGTVTELCRITNPASDLRARIDAADHVIDATVIDRPDDSVLLHCTLTPDDTLRNLLALVDDHRLALDTPITLGPNGITVTVIGPEPNLADAMHDMPAPLSGDVTVDSLTTYDPDSGGLRDVLTDRQRAVLDAAVDLGYYDHPRRATIDDLAAELDLATSTVSEHLRKLEARSLPHLT